MGKPNEHFHLGKAISKRGKVISSRGKVIFAGGKVRVEIARQPGHYRSRY
jgi:hypothetical protein